MKKLTLTLAALGVAATGGVAYAEPSFSVTGMIRQEIANNTGGANQHTSWGSPFNGKMTTSHLGNLVPLGVNVCPALRVLEPIVQMLHHKSRIGRSGLRG